MGHLVHPFLLSDFIYMTILIILLHWFPYMGYTAAVATVNETQKVRGYWNLLLPMISLSATRCSLKENRIW